MNLLSLGGNFKTAKNLKAGWISAELSLAPANASGYNVCPNASPGCKAACIGWFSGRNVFQPARDAKIRKTKLFFEDRPEFMRQLVEDLEYLRRKSKKDKLPVCVRLNCYSDIQWEKIGFKEASNHWTHVMEKFREFHFYDYSKILTRATRRGLPPNYHLTFSRSEVNKDHMFMFARDHKEANIAVVFSGPLPETYLNRKVINGDVNDLRFLDPKGVIVGLSAKGAGKKDQSGFIV